MDVNSLPKTVIRQRRDYDLNPSPSAPESSTLTTRLPSHQGIRRLRNLPAAAESRPRRLERRNNTATWRSVPTYREARESGTENTTRFQHQCC